MCGNRHASSDPAQPAWTLPKFGIHRAAFTDAAIGNRLRRDAAIHQADTEESLHNEAHGLLRCAPRPSLRDISSSPLEETNLQYQSFDLVRAVFDMFIVALDQADIPDHGALLQWNGRALYLQILDHRHRVTAVEDVAVDIPHHDAGINYPGTFRDQPFVAAIGSDVVVAIRIGIFHGTKRASGNGGHGSIPPSQSRAAGM